VLVEGGHRLGDGPRPVAAQAPVKEAVLRDLLLGEAEQLERPRHGDSCHRDERQVAAFRSGDPQRPSFRIAPSDITVPPGDG
jgi:hypothetical protein